MVDNKRYKPLKDQLDNDYLLVKESYPTTVVEAKRLLADYVMPERSGSSNVKREDDDEGVAFSEARTEYKRPCKATDGG